MDARDAVVAPQVADCLVPATIDMKGSNTGTSASGAGQHA